MDGREPQEICWVVFRGRNGFTGICGTVKEHNLRVIGASGVRNQRFRCHIWALVWLAEQAEEERLQAGPRAEEEAYAAANAMELDNEERARYERRDVCRRIAAEWDTQVEGGGGHGDGLAGGATGGGVSGRLARTRGEDEEWDEESEELGDVDEGL